MFHDIDEYVHDYYCNAIYNLYLCSFNCHVTGQYPIKEPIKAFLANIM